MLIASLDLGRTTGWAYGPSGSLPAYGTWTLRRPNENYDLEPGALLRNLIALTDDGLPDVVIVEAFLNPAAQPNSQVIINQLLVHGAVMGWAGVRGIKCVQVSPGTVRNQVCFRGRSPKLPDAITRSLSKDQIKTRQRAETKRMVVETAHLLGLMPRTETSDDIADALLCWKYAEDTFAGVRGRFALMPS